VSNRVAVPRADNGNQAGGLAIAVRSVLKRCRGTWFGWSGTVSPDQDVTTRTLQRGDVSYVLIDLVEVDHQEYYNGFANRVLWPILHYRLDLAEYSRRDLSGYRRVNAQFANRLHDLIEPDDVIWVHDYHLIPLAKMLRDRGHRNRIGYFLHVPFPPPEILTALPNHDWLIPQLSVYDLVGFQTKNDATHFAQYLENESRLRPVFAEPAQGSACPAPLSRPLLRLRSSHRHQIRPETTGHLASVVPSDAHTVTFSRVANYNAGRFSRLQAHTSAEEQWLRGCGGALGGLGYRTHAGHSLKDNRAAG